MKLTTSLLKKAVIVPFVLLSLCSAAQTTNQQEAALPNNKTLHIEFVRSDSDALVFDVQVFQIPEKGCVLTIADQTGDVLFEKKIQAAGYRQTYKIERNNLSKITFKARGKDLNVQQSFNLRFIVEEKLEVTKL